jgi:PleD family two-component response regulator
MGMQKDVLTGFVSGAVDYVTKHFNLQEVCVRVKTHLTLSPAIKKLFQDSETDSLTGLLNRRIFLKKMENEDMRFKQNQKSFSLFFCEIDFF